MLTLTEIRNDLTATFTTNRGRRLYQTWTVEHRILTAYETPLDAINAAQNHHLDGDEILNALLALSATEPLARQAIVVAFQPWIGHHIGTHRVARGERDDRTATLVASFITAATTIVHCARKPVDRLYRHLQRVAEPVGPAAELEQSAGIELLGNTRCQTTGPELVLAGLVAGIRANRITLEDAAIVARIVVDGESSRHQSSGLYLSPRAIQHRVRKVAHRLAGNAA